MTPIESAVGRSGPWFRHRRPHTHSLYFCRLLTPEPSPATARHVYAHPAQAQHAGSGIKLNMPGPEVKQPGCSRRGIADALLSLGSCDGGWSGQECDRSCCGEGRSVRTG
jgi:hypothetical protein